MPARNEWRYLASTEERLVLHFGHPAKKEKGHPSVGSIRVPRRFARCMPVAVTPERYGDCRH